MGKVCSRGSIIKQSIFFIILLAVLQFLRMSLFIFFPEYKEGGHLATPAGTERFANAVAAYSIGPNYGIAAYSHDFPRGEKESVILYQQKDGPQLILLADIAEFPTVNFDSIIVSKRSPSRTFFSGNIITLPGPYISPDPLVKIGYRFPYYWLPWLMRTDIGGNDIDLEIRGFRADEIRRFETDKARVLLLEGQFSAVEFRRRKGIIRQYARPFIDFRRPNYGMLAVLRAKSPDGKALILMAGSENKQSFDKESVDELIQSLSFERELPYDPFEEKYGKNKVVTIERRFQPAGIVGEVLGRLVSKLFFNMRTTATIDDELVRMVVRGDRAEAEALISRGANVNAKSTGGITPLHMAAHFNHKDIVQLLLAKGADVNVKSDAGDTPLSSAAWRGFLDIAELLIASGADVNAKAANGRTALHSAAYQGRKDVVDLLLAKGANPDVMDEDGVTPLQDAKNQGHADIAELLDSLNRR